MDVADPRELRALLGRHGIRAATSLGQHFLVDRGALADIVDAADLTKRDDVLEVGPGPGVLTVELARRARSVTAVEVDRRMVAALEDTLAGVDNVRVVHADALAVDLYGLPERQPTRVVANLPYQITSPLLERFLRDERRAPLLVVLVQAEVAERMTAPAGRERGFLSVFVECYSAARIVRRVGRRAFSPAPRVDSAVVALRTRPRPACAPLDAGAFLGLVSDVFRHRRKQLRAALGYEAGFGRQPAAAALARAGIAATRRAEELDFAEWVALAEALGIARAGASA